jgi:hypothetical protein
MCRTRIVCAEIWTRHSEHSWLAWDTLCISDLKVLNCWRWQGWLGGDNVDRVRGCSRPNTTRRRAPQKEGEAPFMWNSPTTTQYIHDMPFSV